jgi:hypothetical protein
MEVVTCNPDDPDVWYGRSTFDVEDMSRELERLDEEGTSTFVLPDPAIFLVNAFTNKTKYNTLSLRKLPAPLLPAALASSSV